MADPDRLKRSDIINRLAEKNKAKTYLEIGIHDGGNFESININEKIGVDPRPQKGLGRRVTTHPTTSDNFFAQNNKGFDIIFIDGLHLSEQVYKDITNSLECLNDGGYIVCHDMSPLSWRRQARKRRTVAWNGDCWIAWVKLRAERNDLDMYVVDSDSGCGIIRSGKQEKLDLKGKDLVYENLADNRKEWLNLISPEEFFHRFDLTD